MSTTPRLGLAVEAAEVPTLLYGECHASADHEPHPGPHDHNDRGRQMRCVGWPVEGAEPVNPTGGPEADSAAPTVEPGVGAMWDRSGVWATLSRQLGEWEEGSYKPGRLASELDWDEAVGYLIPTLIKYLAPAADLSAAFDLLRGGAPLDPELRQALESSHDRLKDALSGKLSSRDPKEGE